MRVEKPQVAEEAKPFFTDTELAALLKVTRGQDFEARRDHAIIRVLVDTGIRVSGLANLRFWHTFADSWLAAGGNVDDLMNLADWKSIAMPLRYAKGRGVARAAEATSGCPPATGSNAASREMPTMVSLPHSPSMMRRSC